MSDKVLDEQTAGEATRDVLGTLSHLGLYDTLVCEGPLSAPYKTRRESLDLAHSESQPI